VDHSGRALTMRLRSNPFPSAIQPTNQSLTAHPGTKLRPSGATLEAERSPMRLAETAKQRIHQPLLPLTALLASQAPPAVLQIHIDKTNPALTTAFGGKTNPTRHSTSQIAGTNPNQPPNRPDKTNPPLTVASGFGGKTNPTRLATVQIAGTNPIRHLSAACNFLFTVGPACPAGRMPTPDSYGQVNCWDGLAKSSNLPGGCHSHSLRVSPGDFPAVRHSASISCPETLDVCFPDCPITPPSACSLPPPIFRRTCGSRPHGQIFAWISTNCTSGSGLGSGTRSGFSLD
jgi:hypothetical protein